MRTSENIDKIAPAFVLAQAAIRGAEKDGENSFFKKANGKPSAYITFEEVVKAVKGPLNDNEISFSQWPEESGNPAVLKITTRLQHSSGQFMESTSDWPAAKADPQGMGSAMTYAKRYSLSGITGLVSDDDDDGNAANASVNQARNTSTAKPAEPKTAAPAKAAAPATPPAEQVDPSAPITEKQIGLLNSAHKQLDPKHPGIDATGWTYADYVSTRDKLKAQINKAK